MSEDTGQKNRSRPARRVKKVRLQLVGKMVLAVLASLLVAEATWLSVSYVRERADIPRKAEQKTRLLLEAAVDTRNFATLTSEKAVLDRLRTLAGIVGARLEDTAGEPLAVVGLEPDVTVLEALRHEVGARMSADRAYLDVYVPADDLKFRHPMIVRVDLAAYYAELHRALIGTAMTVVNIVVLTTTGLFLALYPILFRPLARIRAAIMSGVSDLDIADSFQIRWDRKDELDDLAGAVNQLLFSASKNYSDTLHTAHEALSKSPVATLVYKPGGELTYANPAALELFGRDSVGELAAEPPGFVILGTDANAPAVTVEAMLANGPVSEEGLVLTRDGPHAMICMGDIGYRSDGTIRRVVAQFLDMDRVLARMARLARMSERATRRRIFADQRSLKLRVMLESCLGILDDDDARVGAATSIIDVEQTIRTWARVHAAVGRARRVLYNRLPEIAGNPGIILPLFRQALSYADFSSAYRDSELRVIATRRDHMVRFDISEQPGEASARKGSSEINNAGELTLCLSALSALVEKCGGTLEIDDNRDRPVAFSFTVPKVMRRPRVAGGTDAADRDAA